MRFKGNTLTITADSPNSQGTVIHSEVFRASAFSNADALVIDADLLGDAAGKLDVYLQRKVAENHWVDWVHFPQLDEASSKSYTLCVSGGLADIIEVGTGDDESTTPSLGAGKFVNVLPGGDIRIVFVAGASTSTGATQTIRITTYTDKH